MTHETALKITAKVTVATIQHMADEAGISFEATFEAILAGGNARRRFEEFMKVAGDHLTKAA
jgi:hypothetical protein